MTPGDAWPIIGNRALIDETRRALDDEGVAVLDVELARLAPDTVVGDFRAMLDTAAELGARHVLTQGQDPDWPRLVQNYAALCELARGYGMTADVEFLSWTKLRGIAEARALVDTAGCENAGVMIDTLHFFRSGCDVAEIERVPAGQLRFIQLSDAAGPTPATVEELIFTARQDRLDPGEGSLPLAALLRRIPAGIPVALEVPNSRRAAIEPDAVRVASALAAARRLEEVPGAAASDGVH